MADALKNFAYSTVATAPSPDDSGTSLVVASGEGARFPTVPFNATVWPASTQPTSANAEIVRVTNVSTDTFTITRAQESSTARHIGVGDQIAQTVTKATLDSYLPLSGGTMTGQIIRNDEGTGFGESGSLLKLRRVLTNASSGNSVISDVNGLAKGTATTTDRLTGIRAVMEDSASAVNKVITNITNSSDTATVSATSHGFAVNEKIAIHGVTHTFNVEVNGAWSVASTATDTFTIVVPSLSAGTYTSGGTATNRSQLYGVYARVNPSLARGGLTGTAINADDVDAFVAYNGGTAKATDAYYLGHGSLTASEWITAFTVDANADYGIRLNGTFANYGLDFYSGTFTGGMIRLKNDVFVVGRNAADSGQVNLFKINTINELEVSAAFRFSGGIAIADNKTITTGTTNGVKIGGATNQKIGFWGHAGGTQPSAYTPTNVSADRSYDANATTINELADVLGTLIADLQSVGLLG